MVKQNFRRFAVCFYFYLLCGLLRHRRLGIQNLVDSGSGGRRFCKSNHQVCNHDECKQCLRHIVHKGYDIALTDAAAVYAVSAKP